MDNLCHSLVGAALSESGLKKRTALATPTLIIGANLPDIDVLAIPFGHGIDFRRGHTHGIVALILLPLLLALAMRWWSRRRAVDGFDFRWTMVLAGIAIVTHPFLDGMNTYGVRWLMPFSGRWYSADSLFIVDPLMWGALAAGWWLSRRASRAGSARPERPARIALSASAVYIALMIAGSVWTRSTVMEDLARSSSTPAQEVTRVVISPRPLSPVARDIIFQEGSSYRFAEASVIQRGWSLLPIPELPLNADHPAARAAASTPEGRKFLVWSQMPYFTVAEGASSASVRLDDARYSMGQPSWAAVLVEVSRGADGVYSSPNFR